MKNKVSFRLVDEMADIKIRVELYNKFIQAMESPAVRKFWGSHLLHWINNGNKQLNEATKIIKLWINFQRITMIS